ncbi:MAG: SpoIID/LytB domain-containing protein [bacterium]
MNKLFFTTFLYAIRPILQRFVIGMLFILSLWNPGLAKEKKAISIPPLHHPAGQEKKSELKIRVLLEELDAQKQNKLQFSSTKDLFIEHIDETEYKKWPEQKIELLLQNKKLYILYPKTQKYVHIKRDMITIHPASNKLTFKNKAYQGALTIQIDKQNNKILFINKLNLDDYIYSVLRYESLSFWPLEMQKVQAVASRTYAIYQMRINRKIKKNCPYDIKNTNFHQVYNGAHSCTHLRKAILDTHNQILTYKNTIALTMFDICCGGVIPWHMKKKDLDKPYLFRKNKCSFCNKKSLRKWHQWNVSIHSKNLLKQLCKNPSLTSKIKQMGTLKNIKIWKKDNAGVVLSVLLYGSRRNVLVPRLQLNASMSPKKKFKSKIFTVEKEGKTITFSGLGYGHNLGLCQLGARELIREGWNYKKVLDFYYPNTKLALLIN